MHETLRRLLTPVPDPLLRHLMYRRRFGRWGNFRHPERFTEHLSHRMLSERGEELAWTCDKMRMKSYAASRCPDLRAPETLWCGTDISDLNVEELPEQWVIKPNHRSGIVHFGTRNTSHEELREVTRGWLRTHDRAALGEWAYRRADHALIVEPRLGAEGTAVPVDYKFFVFHGEVRLLHCDAGRFTGVFQESFYSPQWEKLEIHNGVEHEAELPPPESLDEMLSHAAILGEGFEFMRVDLYEIGGIPFFGELTPYPSGGMDPFEPEEIDVQLGQWWAQEAPA